MRWTDCRSALPSFALRQKAFVRSDCSVQAFAASAAAARSQTAP
jgi:hypothetical protein